jgi:ATP-binding cassette subfamily G (WHITE) protein 2 (SNQ2)
MVLGTSVNALRVAVNAVIASSAYYMAPKTATGSFERSGALFFSLVSQGNHKRDWVQISHAMLLEQNSAALNGFGDLGHEVPKTIQSRAILLKQHRMGYLHPVSFVIALAIAPRQSQKRLGADIPCDAA